MRNYKDIKLLSADVLRSERISSERDFVPVVIQVSGYQDIDCGPVRVELSKNEDHLIISALSLDDLYNPRLSTFSAKYGDLDNLIVRSVTVAPPSQLPSKISEIALSLAPKDPNQISDKIGQYRTFGLEKTVISCSCGAIHTSFPTFHSTWCDVY